VARRTTGGTPALNALQRAAITHRAHPYEAPGVAAGSQGRAPLSACSPGRSVSYGAEAAEALGLDPQRVFKTLVAEVDGAPLLAMVPVAGTLDLKALAAARGGKKAVMAEPATAERLTGYVTGGISPLGTRRRLPVVVDASALGHDTIFCSAGKRGLQMELAPADLVGAADAMTAAIADA
jgi:Cys-tRNA(Pro)/Cys-tRNA(Cys) deacylase